MPHNGRTTRREFFRKTGAGAAACWAAPYWFTGALSAGEKEGSEPKSKNDRFAIAAIGTGDRLMQFIGDAMKYGDVVAVCDVDRQRMERARKRVGEQAEMYEDYRRVLDRNDVEAVLIGTPDHWHTKIAIEAMQAGKDIYCEKPLTLTIDEGKKICQVQKQTGRVFQVGTQQRSEYSAKSKDKQTTFEQQFLQAVALAHSGRLGKIRRVTCSLGTAPSSGSLPQAEVPSHLNWEMWLGQAPLAEYVLGEKDPTNRFRQGRCHYNFRWWYEYSGGKMTDWGAHHIDIAQWALGMDGSGPESVEGQGEFPQPMEGGHPTQADRYNTPTAFRIQCVFPGGAEMIIRDSPSNGIWIEGEKAEIFVNRNQFYDIQGDVVASLAEEPIADEAILKLYKGKRPGSHMRNFFECIRDRSEPVSDVASHHRAMTTAHLANIAMRLGRPLRWDGQSEQIVGDEEAAGWLAREQRKGYEIKV